jgi:hypothetical protein
MIAERLAAAEGKRQRIYITPTYRLPARGFPGPIGDLTARLLPENYMKTGSIFRTRPN